VRAGCPDGWTLEALARRVYELHRARDVRRGRSRAPIPTWDQLDEPARCRLITAYWRTRASYEVGRKQPREVRIDGPVRDHLLSIGPGVLVDARSSGPQQNATRMATPSRRGASA